MVKATDPTGGLSPSVRSALQPPGGKAAPIDAHPAVASDTHASLPEKVIVKPGDSLSRIAARNHMTLGQLRILNPYLFQADLGQTGKKRQADGGLIYPGDEIRLRAPETPPATSQKVIQAAKDHIDQAANAPASGKPSSDRAAAVDAMLRLIPSTDPEHGQYREKVGDLLATLDRPAVNATPEAFQSASDAFNVAVAAYQAGQKAGKSSSDPSQADTFSKALEAYSHATIAVQQLPTGPDKQALQEQLRIMEFTLTQLTAHAPAGGSAEPPQLLGSLPAQPVSTPQPGTVATAPVPIPPPATTTYTPAVQALPDQVANNDVTPGTVVRIGKRNYVLTPSSIQRYVIPPRAQAAAPPPAPDANQPSTPGATPATPVLAKKDPNDPKVKQISEYLKQADHKAIRALVANPDLLNASLPEQKALMTAKLLEGWTSGDDQAAIAKIVEVARQQGENEGFALELDRLYGGEHKGVLRMLEDLGRGMRDKVVRALFGEPPAGVSYSGSFYAAVVAALDRKDVEQLCATLGTTAGASWLAQLPSEIKQALAEKLKSWWPFGGNSSAIAALNSSLAVKP